MSAVILASCAYKDHNLSMNVHILHFPSSPSPCAALVMACLRINLVGPPSPTLFCGSWKLYTDSIFVFDVIERHLNAVVHLPSEPFSQRVVFAHSHSPFLMY